MNCEENIMWHFASWLLFCCQSFFLTGHPSLQCWGVNGQQWMMWVGRSFKRGGVLACKTLALSCQWEHEFPKKNEQELKDSSSSVAHQVCNNNTQSLHDMWLRPLAGHCRGRCPSKRSLWGSLNGSLTSQESHMSVNGLRTYILPSKPNEIGKEYQQIGLRTERTPLEQCTWDTYQAHHRTWLVCLVESIHMWGCFCSISYFFNAGVLQIGDSWMAPCVHCDIGWLRSTPVPSNTSS